MWTVVLVAVALLAIWMFRGSGKRENMPPGPTGLRLLRVLFTMDAKSPDRTMVALQKQYGDIFRLKVGRMDVVILSDPTLIREAFSRPETTGRPTGYMFDLIGVKKGIVFADGEHWVSTRRFTLHHLRNFGMGKARLEDAIRQQAEDFLTKVVAASAGEPLDIGTSLEVAIVNTIWDIVSSETLDIKDDHVLTIMNKAKELGEHTTLFTFIWLMPWLLKLVPDSILGFQKALDLFRYPCLHLIIPAIEEHRKHFDGTSEPSDLIECLLQEQQRDPERFDDTTMVQCLHDLFSAGSETTASTLRWVFCFLCSSPDAQKRVQEEIDAVVGHNRAPSFTDRSQMPFTEAVLMETQRLGDVVPAGVDHMTTAPLQLAGYTIPAGTQITSLLTAVHHNAHIFPEPDRFRPERFLDDDGNVLPNKNLMPFSAGKRSCLGEAMARPELFLFITMALQRFNFRFPDGFQHDFSRSERGGLATPKEFQVIATPRAVS